MQRLALELKDRTREQVAEAWVNTMVDAIRKHDQRHMVTVGIIPWVFVFGGGKPDFHAPSVGKRLDFVAVHFYPKKGEVDKALTALKAYEVGKPHRDRRDVSVVVRRRRVDRIRPQIVRHHRRVDQFLLGHTRRAVTCCETTNAGGSHYSVVAGEVSAVVQGRQSGATA